MEGHTTKLVIKRGEAIITSMSINAGMVAMMTESEPHLPTERRYYALRPISGTLEMQLTPYGASFFKALSNAAQREKHRRRPMAKKVRRAALSTKV